jgi:hypothetical protein
MLLPRAQDPASVSDVEEANRRLEATESFWRTWPSPTARSPLVRADPAFGAGNEGLTYMPTGGPSSRRRQPDIVGVRVEDDYAQTGVGQHPLEQQAERLRLPRARLPHMNVSVEPPAVERHRHPGSQQQLPHGEPGPPRASVREPRADLVGIRGPHGGVVEGNVLGVEDDT